MQSKLEKIYNDHTAFLVGANFDFFLYTKAAPHRCEDKLLEFVMHSVLFTITPVTHIIFACIADISAISESKSFDVVFPVYHASWSPASPTFSIKLLPVLKPTEFQGYNGSSEPVQIQLGKIMSYTQKRSS